MIRRSATHGNRILLDPDAPQVSWMTRADLHDWIWSMPETTVSAALDTNASWLCNMYAVNRPSQSHWHRMRKGLEAPRDPLDPSLPADMPIPLVHFEWSSAGSYAVVPHPEPWSRLGGPDRSGPIYPHDGNTFQRCSRSARPAGPVVAGRVAR
ncbi:hypothetical protein [Sphingomonas corticis]|uniref:Uncharacterized protein n=1 Tax=Sphingomonas corticis TaxID=2722791 RepID=A0ABX1CT19_9SPHN|nr:hypothetical protein [Sphingomonas corticis]NJR79160.1 hypothetical protein [Sphingomonas corticis]